MRVVSLLPSATEIVCALGLRENLVGVSHSCDFPESVKRLPRVTSTAVPYQSASQEIDTFVTESIADNQALYDVDWALLGALEPDVVVSQALCDVCAVSGAEVEAHLGDIPSGPQLVNMEPAKLEDIFSCIERVAAACQVPEVGGALLADLRTRVADVMSRGRLLPRKPNVMLVEWLDPPFVSGHWNPELVQLAGAEETFGNVGGPAYATSWQDVIEAKPEALAVACCGFDVQRTQADLNLLAEDPGFQQAREQVSGRVQVFDGDAYFNRPGPRIVDSLEQLHEFVAAVAVAT